MASERIFRGSDFMHTGADEPPRTVIIESPDAAVVAWCVLPGQRIAAHVHPHGQDTWTILAGRGDYQLDAEGSSRPIEAGDVVVAPTGAVHGVVNTGSGPLSFISVVCPFEAGYEPL